VILITTKRGKNGKPVINFRATGGIQTYTRKPDMRDGPQFLQYRYDVKKMNGASPSDLEIDRLLNPKELEAYKAGHTVNWWDEVTRLAPFQDYQVSVSGGADRVNYYVSGDYMKQQGIVYGDQFKKFSFLSKVEAKITDWMKYGITLSVASKNADGVAADLEKGTILGPYSYVRSTFPGYENWYERYPQTSTTTFNPFWRTLTYDEDRNQNYRSTQFIRLDAPWVKGLSYTVTYALNRWEGHGAQFNDETTFVNTLNQNDLKDQSKFLKDANGYRNNSERTDWYLSHIINYNHTFNDHSFDATLLAERQDVKDRKMTLSAKDFSQAGTTVLGVNGLDLGDATKRGVSTDNSELAQLAYMARVNYVFKQRYHLSASIRRDGYSGFAVGSKYGTFRAVAAAWTASEESFIKDNLGFFDFLKLRASYGENGNPTVGAYATFPTVGTSEYLFGTTTVNTAYANRLANKNLKWETTTSFNLGVDFSLFKNVLSGNIDYYNSNTTDLLIRRAIPVMNGFTTFDDNLVKNHNSGLEIQLNSNNIRTRDFQWSSGLSFWRNRNKIITIYGLDKDGDGKEDDDIANSYFIGKSLGAIYDYTYDGIIQESDVDYINTYGGVPGDIKLKDLNNNKKIDPDDRSIVGYTKPNYSLSLANTFNYKNLELYVMFSTIQGGGKDNYYLASNQYAQNPNTLFATVANWLDKEYWMPEHPSNTIPRPNYVNRYGYKFSQGHSFVRLQDLALSYQLSDKILSRTPVKGLQVYLAGKNLLTWTNWDGLDPETSTTYASVNGFPVMKTVTLGINLTL
jgi:TonB-linked SusC/RagA family outer membrane protein